MTYSIKSTLPYACNFIKISVSSRGRVWMVCSMYMLHLIYSWAYNTDILFTEKNLILLKSCKCDNKKSCFTLQNYRTCNILLLFPDRWYNTSFCPSCTYASINHLSSLSKSQLFQSFFPQRSYNIPIQLYTSQDNYNVKGTNLCCTLHNDLYFHPYKIQMANNCWKEISSP